MKRLWPELMWLQNASVALLTWVHCFTCICLESWNQLILNFSCWNRMDLTFCLSYPTCYQIFFGYLLRQACNPSNDYGISFFVHVLFWCIKRTLTSLFINRECNLGPSTARYWKVKFMAPFFDKCTWLVILDFYCLNLNTKVDRKGVGLWGQHFYS